MGTLLLSSPWFLLYLLHLAVLALAAFWPRTDTTPKGRAGFELLAHEPGTRQPQAHWRGRPRLIDGRLSGMHDGREPLPGWGLGTSLARDYTARFSRAIKRISLN
jgi:hypothetical protein